MSRTLLIVDDEPLIREIIREKIGKHFEHILEAENGAQGIFCLKQYPEVSMVVSDLKMPIMDGLEFLEEARQLGYQKTFVYFTAMVKPQEVTRMSELGVKDIFFKGEINDWLKVVKNVLSGRHERVPTIEND